MFQFRNFPRVPPDPAASLSDESLVRPASSEAGPLLALIEVRESTTWRPAGSAANSGADKDAAHGDDRRDGQQALPGSDRQGRRRRIVGAPAKSGCRHKQRHEYGVEKMMNDRQTTRPASRERNDSTHRRASAHLAAGRHASTGHLCAPGARRIRLIPGHPRRAGTFSLANRIRQGMCTRAPVRLRPLFAY
ncbi:hypothetical protein [Burkholderia ambifaria]|uniref:hypothetical protein n=1 Tax=Burkholderia ambifaria TaxID=152480 RepID=UPI001FC8E3B3|nr:hypothetical protein [Burkholderia ambifaria]